MKKVLEIVMTIIMVIALLATMADVVKQEQNKKAIKDDENSVIKYLNRKYGDGDYEIVDHKVDKCSLFEGCSTTTTLEISTKYLDETFVVHFKDRFNDYSVTDGFLEELYREKWSENGLSFVEYLKKETTKSVSKDVLGSNLSNYVQINFEQMTFNYKYVEFNRLPEVSDLIENATLSNPYFLVDGYESYQLEVFKVDIVTAYNRLEEGALKYNYYIPSRIGIQFKYFNPFDTDTDRYNSYYKSGYIRKENDKFTIYVSPDPIYVERQ